MNVLYGVITFHPLGGSSSLLTAIGMGRGGRVAQDRYLVDERWGETILPRPLDEVTWEAWSVGGEVDPKEADYYLDAWVEPIDHEAAVASQRPAVCDESEATTRASSATETVRRDLRTQPLQSGVATTTAEAEAGGRARDNVDS